MSYYLHDTDVLILWLDNDRVGENICFQILRLVDYNQVKCAIENVLRVQFSSLAPLDILRAYDRANMKPNFMKSKAEDVREEVDLRLGLSFTTYLTNRLHKNFKSFKDMNKRISYGPCQFPAFWFCQQRAIKIKEFKAEEYWRAVISIQYQKGKMIDLHYEKDLNSQEEALKIIKSILKMNLVKIVEVKTKQITIAKPKPMNTVDLLTEASERLHFHALKTTRIAETLYRKGFVSYPRTESRKHSSSFEFQKVLESYSSAGHFQEQAMELIKEYHPVTLEEGEHQEHPPLTPVALPGRHKSLKKNTPTWELHNLIVNHFFASLSTDAVLNEITTTFQIGDYKFLYKHAEFEKLGF